MEKFILIAALVGVVAGPAYSAEKSSEWKHWSISPYARSFGEACKKAPAAIDGFDYPSAVKEHFKQALGSDCKGGTEVWLTPHQRLEQMWSGHKPHVMDSKTVGELPVLQSPDGRPYPKGSVAETAKALSWTFVYDGKTYILYLPLVCFNWSWAFGSPPVMAVAIPVSVARPPAPPANPKRLDPPRPLVGGCPNVYHLKVYVYPWEAMLLPGVAQTAAKEEMEEHFVYGRHDPQHVSRTHYTQLQEALAAGTLHYSSTPHVIRVSLIMTPEAMGGEPAITNEEVLGEITVKDYYSEVPLSLAQQIKKWDAIRLVPVGDEDIASPPRYHKVGFRELRFFFRLPNTKLGEWDSTPDPDCTMGVLFIEKKK